MYIETSLKCRLAYLSHPLGDVKQPSEVAAFECPGTDGLQCGGKGKGAEMRAIHKCLVGDGCYREGIIPVCHSLGDIYGGQVSVIARDDRGLPCVGVKTVSDTVDGGSRGDSPDEREVLPGNPRWHL